MRLEHKAGIDIIYELAVRLYPSSLESFREAISNALDEGSRKVEIQTSLKEIIVEDWGEGIRDPEKFAIFGEATKAKLGGEIIGEKGLGKLSLLRLAKKNGISKNQLLRIKKAIRNKKFRPRKKTITKLMIREF